MDSSRARWSILAALAGEPLVWDAAHRATLENAESSACESSGTWNRPTGRVESLATLPPSWATTGLLRPGAAPICYMQRARQRKVTPALGSAIQRVSQVIYELILRSTGHFRRA